MMQIELSSSEQTIIRDYYPAVDADTVLRAQAADPAAIRARRPALVELAGAACTLGRGLIQPALIYRRLPVNSITHQKLSLDGGFLSGEWITRQLAPASEVFLCAATIGTHLEEKVTQLLKEDPAAALALDAYGSAAVESLTSAFCTACEQETSVHGLKTSLPLSPGLAGWNVLTGQRQIFTLIDPTRIGITLSEMGQMLPRKSATLVMGAGPNFDHPGSVCDLCQMKNTCRQHLHAASI